MKTVEELRPVVYEAIRSGYRLIGPFRPLHFLHKMNLFIFEQIQQPFIEMKRH